MACCTRALKMAELASSAESDGTTTYAQTSGRALGLRRKKNIS